MSDVLGLGKVSREILRRSVFPFLPLEKEPSLDGGSIRLKGRTIVAHSPSIGVPLDALGFFAFHYAASNVASLFAIPRYIVTGIYLPLRTKEEDLRTIAKGLGDETKRFRVKVAAGQTATYYGLEIPLITATCLGEPVKKPERPSENDLVVVVGAVGGEALWLKALSEGRLDIHWSSFTPLPAILQLQRVEGVKLLHDVSEGGLVGALHEIAEEIDLRLDISSRKMPYAEGAEELGKDVLRAPTYGTLIAIIDPETVEALSRNCTELGYPFASVGKVKSGCNVYIDGLKIKGLERISIDEIYGTFKQSRKIT